MTATLTRPDTSNVDAALRALADDALPRCFRLTDMPEIRDVMVCPKPKGHSDPCGLLGRRRTPAHLIGPLTALLAGHTGCDPAADCPHTTAAAAVTEPYQGWTV